MKFMDWVMSWPRWGWYVAALVYSVVASAVLSGLWAAINGNFWEPFWWGMAVAVPVTWLRMWWYHRETDRKKVQVGR